MNWLVAASLFWVFASVTVALLPMRFQYAPGLTLLLAAPVLIAWIARDVGSFAAAAALRNEDPPTPSASYSPSTSPLCAIAMLRCPRARTCTFSPTPW